MGWSLSLQEWPFGQDPRCPGCVSHCSPHYPAHAPRAHARAHTPGYSSWRRVSPCGPPPLSTVVGTSYQPHRKCKAPKGAEPLHKRCRCDPGWLLRRVGAIPTTGLPLIRRKARKGVGDDACSCVFPSLSMLLMVLLLLLLVTAPSGDFALVSSSETEPRLARVLGVSTRHEKIAQPESESASV